jgi:methyl-accepting chemotaxis protein
MLISRKLPIAAAFLTVVSIGVCSIASLQIGRQAVMAETSAKLVAIADGRRNQLETYLANVQQGVIAVTQDSKARLALDGFKFNLSFMGAEGGANIRKRYIEDNTHPPAERHKLETAAVDAYDDTHERYQAKFRDVVAQNGYADMVFIDPEGTIVYTVNKQDDFGTNLKSGPYKDTGIAKLYATLAADPTPDRLAFSDYEAYAPAGSLPVAFIGRALIAPNGLVGFMVAEIPSSGIRDILSNSTGLGETGETILLNADNVLINDSAKTPENDALSVAVDTDIAGRIGGREIVSGMIEGYRGLKADIAAAAIEFNGVKWTLAALIDHDEAQAGMVTMRNAILALAAALLLAAVALSTWFSRTLTRPIDHLVADMRRLAAGDTSISLEGEGRKDEIGDMVRSVAIFRDAAIAKVELEQEAEQTRILSDQERRERESGRVEESRQMKEAVDRLASGLNHLAEGDLTVRIETPFMEGLERLRHDFNASVEKLASTLSDVRGNIESISGNATEMRSAADEMSRRTEHQAASLEQTSAALDEITATVRESSERAVEATRMVGEAKLSTDESSKVVSEAVDAMGRIEQASNEISKIINVIDEIAFQTNLLALNAGVEAARAGEAGKGFAVVAQEVRELAQRAASAAKDIKGLITKSGAEVASGVSLVKATGSALQRIAGHVDDINSHINSIATAAREQAAGLQEINSAVNEMDQVTQKNAEMVEKTTNVVHRLSSEAELLTGLVGQFSLASGSSGYRAAVPRPAPGPAAAASRPAAASPARRMVEKVTRAFGGAKPALATHSSTESWEEF